MRTGAFCFFQLFSEKRTQEPSPERVRSERGREDKPLTPVLYSTREGGEHQYDALAKKTLVGEAKSHRRTLAKRAAREVTFSDLSESELAQLFTTDEYESDYFRFQVSGFDVLVKNELLAEALNVVRTTVFRHRKSALAKIKQYLEGKADDEHR